jgi:hypothetical protein
VVIAAGFFIQGFNRMMRGSNSDLFDPRTEMESDSTRGGSASDGDFGFAFNDSNFSDRLLRIEIMGGSAESRADGEGCTSIIDWARHRKRRREDIKKDNNNGSFLFLLISSLLFFLKKNVENLFGCEEN